MHDLHEGELEAVEMACKWHRGQKYGTMPYMVHLAQVRNVLRKFGYTSQTYCIAAWLHDVMEDVPHVNWHLLAGKWGEDVANLVEAVTGRGYTRKERNKDAHDKLLVNHAAIPLKLADRIANVQACLEAEDRGRLLMYKKEWTKFSELWYPEISDQETRMWLYLEKLLK